jgi:2'-5' RNA ligase
MLVSTRTIAVELSFDPVSEMRLTAVWTQLARRYVKRGPSELGLRPHVSLAVFPESAPTNPEALVLSLAAKLRPFTLQLGRIAAFRTSEGVVFLEPVASSELRSAHRILGALLADEKPLVHPFYREDAWVPHCTIATGVPEDEIDRVIEASRSTDGVGPVTVCRVSLVQYRPAIELYASEIEGYSSGMESV